MIAINELLKYILSFKTVADKEHKVRLFGSRVETQQLKHQQGNLNINGHFD